MQIEQTYRVLENIRTNLKEFTNLTGRTIPIRFFEERYGEYFIAHKLEEHGFEIERIGKTGPDIVTSNGINIEVKTSRKTTRFPGAKKGYAWIIKEKQWKNPLLNFAVFVAADKDPPGVLAFTRKEIMDKVSLCSFTYSNTGKDEMNCRRLDLIEGEGSLDYNMKKARTVLKMTGDPTDFERELNENPEPYFREYGFDRMIRLMKTI